MSEVEYLSIQTTESERIDVTKALQQHLESLMRSGMVELPAGKGVHTFDFDESIDSSLEVGSVPKSTAPQFVKEPAVEMSTSANIIDKKLPGSNSPISELGTQREKSTPETKTDSYGPKMSFADRKASLSVLQSEVADCSKCTELSQFRTQTVFGVGNPAARLVLLGEGPGDQEDRTGEPFVGEAGQLLNKILEACKISRSDVYILNTVKCRPPANRNPAFEELVNCWGFAERQLEIIQPDFICCLGSVAAKSLLKTKLSLGRLRRKFHEYRGSKVLVTYHPAYLLRTPSAKKHVWEDMQMLMKEMDIDWSK